jgi:isopentenyldiphosphate isomerase
VKSPVEMVDIVDETNVVTGCLTRQEVRSQNLLHRGVGILVYNCKGEVYVHQRTSTKDLFPSMFDMLVGGVVSSGEDYLTAARREVQEELGVENDDLEELFHHLYLGPKNRSWIAVYRVLWDGPISHQAEEIAWGGWMAEPDLKAWSETVEIVPDGLSVFHEYLRQRDQFSPITGQSQER